MKTLLEQTLNGFRLNELERIDEIVKMHIADMERSLTQSGHYLAVLSADAQLSSWGAAMEISNGMSYLKNLKILRNSKGDLELDAILKPFQNIKRRIINKSVSEVLVTSNAINKKVGNFHSDKIKNLSTLSNIELAKNEFAWLTETDVNFCAQAFKTVDYRHEDAPVLTVLGAVLRNGYLHTKIREKGGAYGAGAIQDTSSKTFKFFSYRDPNISETFDAFNSSIEWALKSITNTHLEEGILNLISSLDAPSSPANEALSDFSFNNNSINQKLRRQFRQRILECSTLRLVEVTKKYLLRSPRRAVISSQKFEKKLSSLNFDLNNI
jgi:hypothetical protein